MTVPITLQMYLLRKLSDQPERSKLVLIMADIAMIGKLISQHTSKSGLTDMHGMAGTMNVHDESQAKLDIFANDLCREYLRASGLFAALASEEESGVVDLHSPNADYVIAFDPIDGSSNIDVNIPIGTIFSVHKKLPGVNASDTRQFLQPGRDQVLAGYVLYSASTMLVFSWGDGVHAFTLDRDIGEFLLANDHVTFPPETPYYSFNEAYTQFISAEDQRYLGFIRRKTKKARYVGSFIADFHRNLLKGGVLVSPGFDMSGRQLFRPKLRLSYEANPIAMLAEQAGGLATNGEQNILDVKPSSLHERIAAYIGNTELVKVRESL